MKTIALKIDVTKINKEKLFKGAKGTYLDAILFLNDAPDQYGNYGAIAQSVSKEERQAGEKGAILGNAKVVGETAPQSQPYKQEPSKLSVVTDIEPVDDLPF